MACTLAGSRTPARLACGPCTTLRDISHDLPVDQCAEAPLTTHRLYRRGRSRAHGCMCRPLRCQAAHQGMHRATGSALPEDRAIVRCRRAGAHPGQRPAAAQTRRRRRARAPAAAPARQRRPARAAAGAARPARRERRRPRRPPARPTAPPARPPAAPPANRQRLVRTRSGRMVQQQQRVNERTERRASLHSQQTK